jgi:hypothetical protein
MKTSVSILATTRSGAGFQSLCPERLDDVAIGRGDCLLRLERSARPDGANPFLGAVAKHDEHAPDRR